MTEVADLYAQEQKSALGRLHELQESVHRVLEMKTTGDALPVWARISLQLALNLSVRREP